MSDFESRSDRPVLALLAAVYRQALRLYPRTFRRRFGEEMVGAFRRGCRRAFVDGGPWALCRFVARAGRDLLVTALAERRERSEVPARPYGSDSPDPLARPDLPGSPDRVRRGDPLAGPDLLARPDRPGPAHRPRTARRPRRPAMLADLLHDVRFALRSFRKNPGFAALAMLTLALGIGVTTAVFSVANWVMLRPVPGVSDPGGLLTVRFGSPPDESGAGAIFTISHVRYEALRESVGAFRDVMAYMDVAAHVAVEGADEARRVPAQVVTANYFEVLGMALSRGRGFTPEEGRSGGPAVVVVGHGFWRERMGARPEAVGSSLLVNGQPFRVVGVAPPGFRGTELPGEVELWVPVGAHRVVMPNHSADMLSDSRASPWFQLVARLDPPVAAALDRGLPVVGRLTGGGAGKAAGATLDRVRGEIVAVAAAGSERVREGRTVPVLTPGLGAMPWARIRTEQSLGILAGVVGFVLLLTCANVANLTLARASDRGRELAVRRALGAGRTRLARQVLTESSVLSLAAGLVALLVSLGVLRLFEGARLVSSLPPLGRVEPDLRVMAFALLVAAGAGLLFGLVPAVQAGRRAGIDALRRGGATSSRLRDGLVVAQLALALSLVVGAGMLARTVFNLRAVDTGIDRDRLVTFSIEPGLQGYEEARIDGTYAEVLRRVEALPGVHSAALGFPRPFGRRRDQATVVAWGEDLEESGIAADRTRVSSSFFEAVGIPLLGGRTFDEWRLRPEDVVDPGTVVLGASLARRLFPDRPAVGERIAMRVWVRNEEGDHVTDQVPVRVAGVAADVRLEGLDTEPSPRLYSPLGVRRICPGCTGGFYPGEVAVQVRTAGPPAALVPSLREAVAAVDPTLPLFEVATIGQQLDEGIAERLLVARLSGVLALLALTLAGVGVYGVVSASVRRRLRELGIRIALGARPAAVVGMVLGRSARLALLGIGLGLAGAWQVARLVESRLYGVEGLDPPTLAMGSGVLLLLVLIASLLPAARATRVDPVRALREE